MKLTKRLSNVLTIALITGATFANAQTTNVTQSEIVKAQPITATELAITVEQTLAQSMQDVKLTFNSELQNKPKLVVKTSSNKKDDKQLVAKLSLNAE